MEWVETTAKSLEEAKDLALDQLGVAADEAEFEVLEEPRSGLFGRVRGEARVARPGDARRRASQAGAPQSWAIQAEGGRHHGARQGQPERRRRSPAVPTATRRRAGLGQRRSRPRRAPRRAFLAAAPSGRNDRSNRKRASEWMPRTSETSHRCHPRRSGMQRSDSWPVWRRPLVQRHRRISMSMARTSRFGSPATSWA